MNGAENLLKTLEAAGIEVCFANPGTSEMHLVSAIGRSERVRAILCLFEGVVSGAAACIRELGHESGRTASAGR